MKLVFKSNGKVVGVCKNISKLTVHELLQMKKSLEDKRGILVDMNIEK